jgi:hypothetical protein
MSTYDERETEVSRTPLWTPHPATQTPEQLMADFDAGAQGLKDVDMRTTLWAVINDIRDSYRRAINTAGVNPAPIEAEVDDYLAHHYED